MTSQPIDRVEIVCHDLMALPWGEHFAAALEDANIPIDNMPAELREQYPLSPAMLYLGDGGPVIFLSEDATADDLAHECRHGRQYLTFPDNLRKPKDIKHLYIFYAFAEADAYAHQAITLIQSMAAGQRDLENEREIEKLYKDENPDVFWEPVRFILYSVLNYAPEDLVQLYQKEPEKLDEIMFQVFSWSMQVFVPHQYEERHLDGVHTDISKTRSNGSLFVGRREDFGAHTQEDIAFFLSCVGQFGIVEGTSSSYLINSAGYGPDPSDYMNPLFTESSIFELARMNKTLDSTRDRTDVPICSIKS